MKNIKLRSCAAKAAHLNGSSPRFARPIIIITTFTLLLSGCTAIGNFADGIGKHMPTIGEPCNHWQCVTESGQRTSEQLKKQEEAAEKQKNTKENSPVPQVPAANQ